MRTLLIILGIWLLINVLFAVIMIPPRRSNGERGQSGLSPALIDPNSRLEEDEGFSLRHAIIAVALGAFFSLSPPLLQAYDAIAAFVRKLRRGEGAGVKTSDDE
ncbi:hypothetical protein [Bradyrhizobium diazoefficiens]|uniref:Uncharacterized protein n=1 Tax=Bradyrhizobium diazoefficiens TaxID=1355477 RepID=A0A809X707_9BRAD|nr:hypothetical protein XF1B_59380 [Bradyrhizobium diazoefficiens]BCE49520.1 hypothetical protein XF4B_58690 [Bradyrhizobium diazoefficiens]BCE93031.1 hypothetical protein XF10B_58290 [Bradyrhizobium diazoefficiens]BCF27962.1 hypothetical protein XF14B_59140 [Bradyrhizobium diazoefficiens]